MICSVVHYFEIQYIKLVGHFVRLITTECQIQAANDVNLRVKIANSNSEFDQTFHSDKLAFGSFDLISDSYNEPTYSFKVDNSITSLLLCCRFRLRYCSYYDCYYLHWDDNVCPPLARINGLKKGLYSSSGLTRYIDQENDEVWVCVCVCSICVHE